MSFDPVLVQLFEQNTFVAPKVAHRSSDCGVQDFNSPSVRTGPGGLFAFVDARGLGPSAWSSAVYSLSISCQYS